MKIKRLAIYKRLKDLAKSGSEVEAWDYLFFAAINDIHGFFCDELAVEFPARCVSCEALLMHPQRQLNTNMMKLLLKNGAYPSVELCASQYRYGRRDKAWTPLKRAVESGCSVDDVKHLLSSGADVNLRPRSICVNGIIRHPTFACTDCDTPLMAAVRRGDVAMIRFLMAHGADASVVIHTDGGLSKTALAVAAEAGNNEQVITELVTCGADVNQSLGPRGTVLHHYIYNDKLVNLLVRLGADPNARAGTGYSVFLEVLLRGDVDNECHLDLVLQSLRLLLPATRDLDRYLQTRSAILRLNGECTKLMLQHGARFVYSHAFLAESSRFCMRFMPINRTQHSERFIELLRAADTDFSGVRQRIASVDRRKWKPLNLAVLDQKLSQPLTLQAWCVISVRRQFRNVSNCGMWARIDALPVPTIIKNRLKLIVW